MSSAASCRFDAAGPSRRSPAPRREDGPASVPRLHLAEGPTTLARALRPGHSPWGMACASPSGAHTPSLRRRSRPLLSTPCSHGVSKGVDYADRRCAGLHAVMERLATFFEGVTTQLSVDLDHRNDALSEHLGTW